MKSKYKICPNLTIRKEQTIQGSEIDKCEVYASYDN